MNQTSGFLSLAAAVLLAAPAPALAQSLWFEPAVAEQCSGNGFRQHAAIITGTGYAGDWVAACARTTATIQGNVVASRDCRWAGTRVWGKFDVADASCRWNLRFLEPLPRTCSSVGMRRYDAIVTGDAFTGDWIQACNQTPAVIQGVVRSSHSCRWDGLRVWGSFDAPDPTCGVPAGQAGPAGSYQQSCIVTAASATTITAKCLGWNGASVRDTVLESADTCVGDIANVGGTLRCNRGSAPPRGAQPRDCPYTWYDANKNGGTLGASCYNGSHFAPGMVEPEPLTGVSSCVGEVFLAAKDGRLRLLCSKATPPKGSYTASCRNIYVDEGRLWALCRGDGRETWSSIDLGKCTRPIQNDGGQLLCGSVPTTPAPKLVGLTYEQAIEQLKNSGHRLNSSTASGCLGVISNLRVEEQVPPPGEPLRDGAPIEVLRCSTIKPAEGPSCTTPKAHVFARRCNRQCTTIQTPVTCEKESEVKAQLEAVEVSCKFTPGVCK